MELDSSTIIYIVAVIVYFLYSTFFRKKTPDQQETLPEEDREHPDAQPKKTVSFDDLLKEIRREQGERERDMEIPEQEVIVREIPREAPVKREHFGEPEKYKKPRQVSYEESRQTIKNYETQPLVKLDDQVDLEATEKILGEVEDVAGEYSYSNKYGVLLKNPETIREAIVVAEILQRKHF